MKDELREQHNAHSEIVRTLASVHLDLSRSKAEAAQTISEEQVQLNRITKELEELKTENSNLFQKDPDLLTDRRSQLLRSPNENKVRTKS